MKRRIILIIIFFILSTLFYIILSFERNIKIEQHLEHTTKQYIHNYEVLYKKYKTLSKIIFNTTINTKEVKEIFAKTLSSNKKQKDATRKELYLHLKKRYDVLKQYNIKQLHFHLKNNDSFLRFHRPQKFGDNLSDIRETVKYVNKNQTAVDGFEEGRIYNGYRFVFPMFYKNEYIGSVEISFSTLAMNKEFINSYNVTSSFLILKETVNKKVFKNEQKNYETSLLKDFDIEKRMIKEIEKLRDLKAKQPISKKTKRIIEQEARTNKSFSIYDDKRKEIMTLIKVQNPISKKVVGIFVVRSSAQYIFNKTLNFQVLFLLINIFILSVLLFINKEKKYREKIEKKNEELISSKKTIEELNSTLEERVTQEILKNKQKEQHLISQSRLAQMGEMISMIAHQWRQPLTAISATANNLSFKLMMDSYDKKEFETEINLIANYSQHLSKTIDDFRGFFKSNKKKENTTLTSIVNDTLSIVKTSVENKNIRIITDLNCKNTIKTYPNEVKQVLLNIIKNAEDNFIDERNNNKIENPTITIKTFNSKEKQYILQVIDNGGGIPEDIIDKIFDPYFSTKEEKDGTGLGLYMSKTIIEEHCNGKIEVYNESNNTIFNVIFKEDI